MPTHISGENINQRATISNPLAVNVVDNVATVDFATNDIKEASATVTYIGMEDKSGAWYVKKIDTASDTSFQHATENNNATYTTYDTAWTARASLTYENFSEAF